MFNEGNKPETAAASEGVEGLAAYQFMFIAPWGEKLKIRAACVRLMVEAGSSSKPFRLSLKWSNSRDLRHN